ncbi:MAG: VWA domain-containing protein [Pseudomonadota bacterium]
MIEHLSHFHFLRPEWLLLVLAMPALELLLRREQRSDDPFKGIIAPHLLENLRLDRSSRRWLTPANLALALAALSIVIAAGPTWRQQPSPLAADAAPLVLVVDLSASMDATDVQPSRLERAKQKITDLLAAVPDKQAGLIGFAGSAHTVLPLSPDHAILNSYLASLDTGMMPREGKFPEYALPEIERMLGDGQRAANILLLTDGAGSDSAAAMAAWFSTRQHRLLVYGFGDTDPARSDAPLARDQLQSLASSVGGDYFDATIDDRDIRAINRALRVEFLIVDSAALPWLDAGYVLVFPAMLLSLLWFRRGWTRLWSVMLLPFLLVVSPEQVVQAQEADESHAAQPSLLERGGDAFVGLWLTPDQYGWVLLELGYYDKAARVFDDPMWQATARYYREDFAESASLFTRRDSEAALFNEANARAHGRDYTGALSRYDELLARNPEYPGARQNRDRMQTIIEELSQMAESPQGEQNKPSSGGGGSGDGGGELTEDERKRLQLTADDVLASPETAEMWMKAVQQDPSRFLRTKFSIQLNERGVQDP